VGQTQAILATIDNLLAQAGTDKRTILTAQIWLKDMSDFAAMNTVWCAWVDPVNKPVRACVQSTLSDPAFLVEIQVTAAAAAMD
jgi:enamine deaminase RidA (YjgF/YER057c/UK114 family)